MGKATIGWDNLFTYDSLVHAMAGSAGGVTAMTTFYPLDIVRSRLQVDDLAKGKNTWALIKEILDSEGLEGLYRGLEPVLISLCASNFVYFYSFHGLRAMFKNSEPSALRDLFLGSIAGTFNVLLTTPLWVVNMRMKMQGAKLKNGGEMTRNAPRYKNIFHGIYKIASTEGVPALWAGAIPSLVLVTNPAIQFMIYENLKRRTQLWTGKEQIKGSNALLLGAISKSLSTVLTYPLQLVQSKLRYGSEDVKNKNMMQVIRMILRRNGPGGLYKGMEAKLYQTVLATALMFFTYEKIAAFVFTIMKGSRKMKK
ncbi:peroxisomal membrane protein PMP34-like [Tetranychus urticae]|uniref:Peroxisomal membrane protein PMP34 n=1 Tax=Tetranychus urticae TaxID=32264 RepID=T1L2V7_TETUR|nr:peroxisomal membrane protein PMP34-like [Tetranychus urticae]